jgi:hypothetical protein
MALSFHGDSLPDNAPLSQSTGPISYRTLFYFAWLHPISRHSHCIPGPFLPAVPLSPFVPRVAVLRAPSLCFVSPRLQCYLP